MTTPFVDVLMACVEHVNTQLGPYLREVAYRRAMVACLRSYKYNVLEEVTVPVMYEDPQHVLVKVQDIIMDIVVVDPDGNFTHVLELKHKDTTPSSVKEACDQLQGYKDVLAKQGQTIEECWVLFFQKKADSQPKLIQV